MPGSSRPNGRIRVYDDGVVRSTVVVCRRGQILELRRGDLTGKALKVAEGGQRRWASQEEWISAICAEAGVERQEWAILGDTSGCFIGELRTLIAELRHLQDMYNQSRTVGARMFWAEYIAEISSAGCMDFPGSHPYIMACQYLALRVCRLSIKMTDYYRKRGPRYGWFEDQFMSLIVFSGGYFKEEFGEWVKMRKSRTPYTLVIGPYRSDREGPMTMEEMPDLDLFEPFDCVKEALQSVRVLSA